MNERLGIFEELQALRATLGPFAYAAPELIHEPDDEPDAVLVDSVRDEIRDILKNVGHRLAAIKVQRRAGPRIIIKDDLPATKNLRIQPSPYSISDVLMSVTEAYNITLYALLSPLRSRPVAHARFAAVLMLREKRKMSFPRIGRTLKRDHTSAMYAYAKAQKLLEADPAWAALYRAAEHVLDHK